MKQKNNKKKHTNTLIAIVGVIFVLSLVAAMIILLKSDNKKDTKNDQTSSTLSTSTSTNTASTTSEVTSNIVSDPTSSKTTTTKSTKTTTNNKETSKKTTTKKQSSKDCNIEELERIAEANKPNKYAVWKTKPTFNVPNGIDYGIGYQKFFWMWHKIGTITDMGVTRDNYIWVVASDKESGAGYPSGEGNTIHEINPSGHFKNAMKYMSAKPTDSGTKEGERRGVVSLYYFTGVTSISCN